MYSKLTPESAKRESDEFLIKVMNKCEPTSGAHMVAKNELQRRRDLDSHRIRFRWTVAGAIVVGALGVGFAVLKWVVPLIG